MVQLGEIQLQSRIVVASGALGYGRRWPHRWLIDFRQLGAITLKTVTLNPEEGNYRWYAPWKVLRRFPDGSGWINCFGLTNSGLSDLIEHKLPKVLELPVIVSIWGDTYSELATMIAILNETDILAIELNISCPNVAYSKLQDLDNIEDAFPRLIRESRHPLIIKVGEGQDYIKIAQITQQAGFSAISAINTVRSNNSGGISGPMIKNRAVEVVSQIHQAVPKLAIIGGGGIENWDDAQDFLNAGATAVSLASMFIWYPPYQSFPFWKIRQIIKEERKS